MMKEPKIRDPRQEAERRMDHVYGCFFMLCAVMSLPLAIAVLLGSLVAIKWLWGVLLHG